jgi:Kunitz/Bovine pancreatic trypsin inhibitor domain
MAVRGYLFALLACAVAVFAAGQDSGGGGGGDGERSAAEMYEICQLPSVHGPCRANLQRFFFDWQSQTCQLFIYGGNIVNVTYDF